jgi:hypothetical protein
MDWTCSSKDTASAVVVVAVLALGLLAWSGCSSSPCANAEQNCSGVCADLQSNPNHCGACGNSCGEGEVCRMGSCTASCPAGQMDCGGTCVNAQVNPEHCGECGVACDPGQVCNQGSCAVECAEELTACSGACVDTSFNPNHCGGCGQACDAPNTIPACGNGNCTTVACAPNFADCDQDGSNGCEVDVESTASACGGCNIQCGVAQSCSDASCETESIPDTWRINELSSEDCVGNPFHDAHTGDDNGGIAVERSGFYYTGDNATGEFSFEDASPLRRGPQQESIFYDMATGTLYAFTEEGTTFTDCGTVDGFVELEPGSLDPVGDPVSLSQSIDTCAGTDEPGLFAGMGIVVLHVDGTTWEIDLSDGTVTDLGGSVDVSDAETSENWAFWGVTERFDGDTHLVYRADTENVNAIVRQTVSDGSQDIILNLTSLENDTGGDADDMATIAVDFARGLWVYHSEDIGELLGISVEDAEEAVGVCPATVEAPVSSN